MLEPSSSISPEEPAAARQSMKLVLACAGESQGSLPSAVRLKSTFIEAEKAYVATFLEVQAKCIDRYRAYENWQKYDDAWIKQAFFAGELICHATTFEKGRMMLEECYQAACIIAAENAGKEDNSRIYSIVKTIVKQMGRSEALCSRALDIILDFPRLNKAGSNVLSLAGGETTTSIVKKGPPLTTSEIVLQRINAKASISALDSLVQWSGKLWNSTTTFFLGRDTGVKSHVLSQMSELTIRLVRKIGERNIEFSKNLIGLAVRLRELQKDQAKFEKKKFHFHPRHELEKLDFAKGVVSKLAELVECSPLASEVADGYFCLYQILAKQGEFQSALQMLSLAKKATHIYCNKTFALACENTERRQEVIKQIRLIGGKELPDRIVVVAEAAFQCGAIEEANQLYFEAWQASLKQLGDQGINNHEWMIGRHFIDISCKSGLQFDGMNAVNLLNYCQSRVIEELNKDCREPQSRTLSFANLVVFQSASIGGIELASNLVELIDKASRQKKYGASATSYKPRERDAAYTEMAKGAARYQDFQVVSDCIDKIKLSKANATYEVTKIFAEKGDFTNALIASDLSSSQIGEKGSSTTDKAEEGMMSKSVLFFDRGESALNIAEAMIEYHEPWDRVIQLLNDAATLGLEDGNLERVFALAHAYEEVRDALPEIMLKAAASNRSALKLDALRLILSGLREIFPELTAIDPL